MTTTYSVIFMMAATIVRHWALFKIYQYLPGAPVNFYIQFFLKAEVFKGLYLLVLIIHPQGHPNIYQNCKKKLCITFNEYTILY